APIDHLPLPTLEVLGDVVHAHERLAVHFYCRATHDGFPILASARARLTTTAITRSQRGLAIDVDIGRPTHRDAAAGLALCVIVYACCWLRHRLMNPWH